MSSWASLTLQSRWERERERERGGEKRRVNPPATADEIVEGLVVLVWIGVGVEEQDRPNSLDTTRNLPEPLVLHDELRAEHLSAMRVEFGLHLLDLHWELLTWDDRSWDHRRKIMNIIFCFRIRIWNLGCGGVGGWVGVGGSEEWQQEVTRVQWE
jgi:hypothetical protein